MSAHPHQLHALAALWSLRAVWPRLLDRAAAYRTAAADHGDLGTLQAWRPGSGVRTACDGDAILDAVIRYAGDPAADNPFSVRLRRASDTLTWAARVSLGGEYRRRTDPLAQLLEHTPTMAPDTARNLALWVDEQDQAVRKVLAVGTDHQLVPRIRCPHCDVAGELAIRTSAPRAQRVIVCTAVGCVCAGPGCGCGMSIEVDTVVHVWTPPELDTALTPRAATP